MHRIFLFVFILLLYGCNNQPDGMDVFNNELGSNKTIALNALINSFNQFLLDNYSSELTSDERLKLFLREVTNDNLNLKFDTSNSRKIIELMEQSGLRKDIYIYDSEIETYLNDYNIEQYLPEPKPPIDLGDVDVVLEDLVEIPQVELTEELKTELEERKLVNEERRRRREELYKRSPKFNSNGLYLYALAKSKQMDSTVIQYVEAQHRFSELHPIWIASIYLNNMTDEQQAGWYNKLPLIVDIYYQMLLYKFEVWVPA
jgi:hypothetical protein